MLITFGIDWQTARRGFTQASDLGLPPGGFPDHLTIVCADGTTRIFEKGAVRRDAEYHIDEVLYTFEEYRVTIFND